MWKPYAEIRNHVQDFDVKYRLYRVEEGGRKATYQGLRCDFFYKGDSINVGSYCIHPEFEDISGEIIMETDKPVPLEGTARMWILFPEMREKIHSKRISVGVKGYMMEGSRKIEELEVIRIVGLHNNHDD